VAINPYLNIRASSTFDAFVFQSEGKSSLKKLVRFELLDSREHIYNLVLCTILADGTEDCESAVKNGDIYSVLDTVAHISLVFTDHYPDRKIFFRGSDPVRTRKYQIRMSNNSTAVARYFDIEGLIIEENVLMLREAFRRGKNYSGFIFTRKNDQRPLR
jgi:hypothetical protein